MKAKLEFTKDTYESAKMRFKVNDNITLNGEEWASVPNDPIGALFWFSTQAAKPIWKKDGTLKGWDEVDDEIRQKLWEVVQCVGEQNGWEIEGMPI